MYKNVLQAISGIEIYPLVSFAIFFLFFLGLMIVAAARREHIAFLSNISLENETDDTTTEADTRL